MTITTKMAELAQAYARSLTVIPDEPIDPMGTHEYVAGQQCPFQMWDTIENTVVPVTVVEYSVTEGASVPTVLFTSRKTGRARASVDFLFKTKEDAQTSIDRYVALELVEQAKLEVASIAYELMPVLLANAQSQYKLRVFAENMASMAIWDYDQDDGEPYTECDEPGEGWLDSHCALMDKIEVARKLVTDSPAVTGEVDETAIASFLQNRVESGDLLLGDVGVRMTRYGTMAPADFIAEMQERIALNDAELGE